MKPFKEQLGWHRFKGQMNNNPTRRDQFTFITLLAVLFAVWPLTIMSGIQNYKRTGSPFRSGV